MCCGFESSKNVEAAFIMEVETEKDTTACRQYHAAILRIKSKDCEEKYDQKAKGT